ncbi:MAG: AAA family ATPase, partial [SAR324 cluster bacterium]|nr:AAA family ATPase [SAR324 cluster bacterium]
VRELSREVQRLKAQLNALGPVNLAAPNEHVVLVERLQFLTEQSEDLQKAVDDLKRTIRDINVESRRRFREMFDQVNEHFGEVFTKLFGGGEAQMVLTESEDLLDAGIDIVAQPPGKKLQNINLLSGGEKALTALSLIFAIFLIKPSPFCLLDEVDAPLDDANVGRFTNLIRQLADGSQFIIITHNKKTMELGDRLYGVTMEEPGISKTVSVHFQEAERMVA